MPKYIDLTAEMYDGAPTMPMDPKLSISWHCTLDTLGYNLSRVTTSTHQGTHIDAPLHMIEGGETIDHISLDRLIVRAVKADLKWKKPKEDIRVKDLLPYEKYINEGCSVIIDTGWAKVFPKKEFFSDFPRITLELAEWFADKGVGIVGMDMPSPTPEDWKGVHVAMLSRGTLIVEGLANLEALGSEPFTFFAMPLKLKQRDGSPIRAIAIID
jgi:kynurenine formamidase